jgi:VWFA-related protein
VNRTIGLATVIAGVVWGGAWSPQATPRTVWIQTTVTNDAGHLVTSFRQDDFTILANDEKRDVTVFSKDELPAAISLMLDASLSMRMQTLNVHRAASLLMHEFVRGDRVSIGSFDGAVLVSDRFTANRARILWSLDQPRGGASTPCVPPATQGRPGQLGDRNAPPTPGAGGTAMWDAVWCGVRELRGDTESIRKVLIVISDGKDNSSRSTEDSVLRHAQASGALVYTVGLRGTEPLDRSDERLRRLAAATGGRYFAVNAGDSLEPVFARIGEELRGQYVLGFEPARVLIRMDWSITEGSPPQFLYLSGTLLPLSVDTRAAMQVIVSLVVLGAALYVILSKKYPDDVQKWAFGVVGMIVGYWLPNGQ